MIKPLSAQYKHDRKTSMLYFDEQDPMEFCMRGGICWPIKYEINGRIDTNGYAVMAGMDVDSKVVYVFEEQQWVTIDHIIRDNKIEHHGLSQWFNRLWNDYFASKFYFHQPHQLAKRFRLQASRSDMIKPKPKFKELPPTDTDDIVAAIWHIVKEGALKYTKGGLVEEQLKMVKAGDKQVLPAVHALGCALVGLARYPWRKPYQKPIQEIFIK